MPSPIDAVRVALEHNRNAANKLARDKGVAETRKLLVQAQRDLERRLREAEGLSGPGKGSFTAVQLRTALAQVKHVAVELNPKLKGVLLSKSKEAAELSAENTIKYLEKADKAFRGVGVQPLALNQARMFDQAVSGAESSILRRLAASDEPAKLGVLQRYGVETVGFFEKEMQLGLITKKPFAEIRDALVDKSPFLQGAPGHWADRIVRTELMGAYNRATWEATREADEELGDVVKILAAHFDDRTGADSFAIHGQIRRPVEAFEWWDGLFQHPPNRPNDRETVVTHRISWKLPGFLKWRSDGEVSARWKKDGRKGSPPPRPKMTTVDVNLFGKPQKKQDQEQEKKDD